MSELKRMEIDLSNFKLSVSCDARDSFFAGMWLETIADWFKKKSPKLSEGEKIPVGFWPAKLVREPSGFAISELCPSSQQFHGGAEFCMRAYRHQITYCEFYDAVFDPVFAGLDCAVHDSVLNGEHLRGWRHLSKDGFSGWHFTAQGESHFRNLKRLPIYKLIETRPDLIKYFGLPIGSGVLSPSVVFEQPS